MDDATWRAAWELKLFGYIDLTRAIYPAMCRRGHGVLVNVVGYAGERPSSGYIAGSLANAGILEMTRRHARVSLAHGVPPLPGNTSEERRAEQECHSTSESLGTRKH